MTAPTTKTFAQLVTQQVAAIQASAAGLVDFTIGSILRAIVEANSNVVLWLQGLVLTLLATTRAATSTGAALDTFVQDYGLARLPGATASGTATFGRFSTVGTGLVPVGATAETADGSQQFTVTLDVTNPHYNAGLGGYTMASTVATVDVPIAGSAVGLGGNVVAGAVALITAALPGIDTVTNAAPLSGGADAESDAALRTRFQAYIASLSKATVTAIGEAVASVEAGLQYTITENQNVDASPHYGFFFVVISDTSPTVQAAVYAAVDLVRPATVAFAVYGPTITTANVSLTVTVLGGFDHTAVAAQVQAAIIAYIDSLTLGQTLAYTRLSAIAYAASTGVSIVSSVLLNSGTADMTATATQVIRHGTVTVS